jgi:hypothetical protein
MGIFQVPTESWRPNLKEAHCHLCSACDRYSHFGAKTADRHMLNGSSCFALAAGGRITNTPNYVRIYRFIHTTCYFFFWLERTDGGIHFFSNQNLGPDWTSWMQCPASACVSELWTETIRLLPRAVPCVQTPPTAARSRRASSYHALLQRLGCLASLQSHLHKSNQSGFSSKPQ